ncbi:unnamed protein product [Lota lota]
MALPWMGKERGINAGNNEFMTNNTSNEMDPMKADLEGVMMNTQSCMDHSILAIFEDSTVASEDKIDVEEESESSLLTALTEILDSVEDDGGTLSPFDTLPDSEYLNDQKARNTLSEGRQRKPKLRSSTVAFTQRGDEEEEEEAQNTSRHHSVPQPFKAPYQKAIHCTASLQVRAERDMEIFASPSLVNLVRLMHPYCLQVHLEEDSKSWSRRAAPSKPHTSPALPSQGEILKYVKPSGDSDEEIDVDLLDDEATDSGQQNTTAEAVQLKGVLVNRDACRRQAAKEKKRVSFGPVLVTSIAQPEEEESDPNEATREEEEPTQTACLSPDDCTEATDTTPAPLTPPTCPPGGNQSKVTHYRAVPSSQGQVKPKSLSLQQYRQLRQKRQPLMEKQGNNTTKWPLLSETPKELPPFLCLQGTMKTHRDTTSHRNGGGKATGGQSSSNSVHPRRSKRSRTEPKGISPPCPVSDCTAAVENKAVNSDPPNPVLLPMPATRPAVSRADCSRLPSTTVTPHVLPGTGFLHEIRKQLAKMEQYSTETTTKLAPPNQNPNSELLQKTEVDVTQQRAVLRPLQCPTTHTMLTSETKKPLSTECIHRPINESLPKTPESLNPGATMEAKPPASLRSCARPSAPANVLRPVVEEKEATGTALSFTCPEEPPHAPAPPSCGVFAPLGDSGIEATDLTSLLEQFEETQGSTVGKCRDDLPPFLIGGIHNSNLQVLGLLQCEPAGPEAGARLPLSPNAHALTDLNFDAPQTTNPHIPSDGFPLALSTDIVPNTQDPSLAKQQWKHPLLSTHRRQPVKPKAPGSRSIQIIDPQPLPYKKTQTPIPSKPAGTQASQMHPSSSHVSSDHDYCAPQDVPVSTTGCNQRDTSTPPMVTSNPRTSCQADGPLKRADASENQRAVSDTKLPTDPAPTLSGGAELDHCPATTAVEDRMKQCIFATPPPSPPRRGREKETARRYRKSRRSDSGSNSPSSSSSSSSCSSSSCSSGSPSPKRKRFCPQRSESSSCSSSSSGSRSPPRRYHFTYSRSRSSGSRSKSWSQSGSRSRSRSPRNHRKRWRGEVRSKESRRHQRRQEMRIHKLKAIDERRVVYVGRIRRTMTHDELRERFSLIGEVESVSLHFRDRSDSYGFVTFHHMEDAFAAIENGSKLRRPDELPFDICFGGRRQFCKSDYADLDSTKDEEAHGKFEDLDFDSLLKQAQKGAKS